MRTSLLALLLTVPAYGQVRETTTVYPDGKRVTVREGIAPATAPATPPTIIYRFVQSPSAPVFVPVAPKPYVVSHERFGLFGLRTRTEYSDGHVERVGPLGFRR